MSAIYRSGTREKFERLRDDIVRRLESHYEAGDVIEFDVETGLEERANLETGFVEVFDNRTRTYFLRINGGARRTSGAPVRPARQRAGPRTLLPRDFSSNHVVAARKAAREMAGPAPLTATFLGEIADKIEALLPPREPQPKED